MLDGVQADLVVLPELFSSGYFFRSRSDLEEVAETVSSGPTITFLQEWASRLDATMVAGLAERESDSIYNSAVIVEPEGKVTTYRKVHLYYKETELFSPGDLGFPVVEVGDEDQPSYRLGVMVCFDWYFPESARSLALKGADVIAHPSNLVLPHCPDAMPVRARENHVFTLTANRTGEETVGGESLSFIGTSEICAPDGTILQQAGREGDAILTAEIDPHAARDRHINRYNDVLGDRRPSMYASSTGDASS